MSLHGYGRSVLYPFSCKSLGQKLNQTMIQQFDESVKAILHGIKPRYLTGQAWKIPDLYTVNGDLVDYLFSAFNIPSLNVEVGISVILTTRSLLIIRNQPIKRVSGRL